jgi:hypothetical protein
MEGVQVKTSRAEAGETGGRIMFDHGYARFVTVIEPIDSSAMKGVPLPTTRRVTSCRRAAYL